MAVSVPISAPAGAVGAVGLYLGAESDSGFYRIAADNIGVALGCVLKFDFGATVHTSTEPIWLPAGAVSATSIQLNDADTGLYSTATGVADMAAAGVRAQSWNVDGIMVENAITKFPTWVASAPAQITTFGSAATWTTATTLTLWTHGGINRPVHVEAEFRFEWGETAAVAYTGECRLQVSVDGGSTWATGIPSIHYMGTGTGGCGYRGSGVVFYDAEHATATGDIQVRTQWKVSNTSMDRLVNQHIKARAMQLY
jgi:hypothetical protein